MSVATIERLRSAALGVMTRAYAPYSRFRVGAALGCADQHIFVGCNVENASYGATICAERAALLAGIATGARTFDRLVIVTEAEDATPPCGMCRQMLIEFAPRLEIVSFTTNGAEEHWNLGELLPVPFTPSFLASR